MGNALMAPVNLSFPEKFNQPCLKMLHLFISKKMIFPLKIDGKPFNLQNINRGVALRLCSGQAAP